MPVIMVSARGDPVDRVRGFARGCDDYVVKPCIFVGGPPRPGLFVPEPARGGLLGLQELGVDLVFLRQPPLHLARDFHHAALLAISTKAVIAF